jgi:hypothetical protein
MTDKTQGTIFTFRNDIWKADTDVIINKFEDLEAFTSVLSNEEIIEIAPFLLGYHHLNFNN